MRRSVKIQRLVGMFSILGILVASAVWYAASPNSVEAITALALPSNVTYSSSIPACSSFFATLHNDRNLAVGVGVGAPKILTVCGNADVPQLDAADNKASSLRGAGCMRVYEYPNFTGRSLLFWTEGKGSTKLVYENKDLHISGWGDRISSLKFRAELNNTSQRCLELLP